MSVGYTSHLLLTSYLTGAPHNFVGSVVAFFMCLMRDIPQTVNFDCPRVSKNDSCHSPSSTEPSAVL